MRYLIILFLLCGCASRGIPIEIYSTSPKTQEEIRIIDEKNTLSVLGDDSYFIKAMTLEPLANKDEKYLELPIALSIYYEWRKTNFTELSGYINDKNILKTREDLIIEWNKRIVRRAEIIRRIKNEK